MPFLTFKGWVLALESVLADYSLCFLLLRVEYALLFAIAAESAG